MVEKMEWNSNFATSHLHEICLPIGMRPRYIFIDSSGPDLVMPETSVNNRHYILYIYSRYFIFNIYFAKIHHKLKWNLDTMINSGIRTKVFYYQAASFGYVFSWTLTSNIVMSILHMLKLMHDIYIPVSGYRLFHMWLKGYIFSCVLYCDECLIE